jgi:predicted nucleic acid-binding protein
MLVLDTNVLSALMLDPAVPKVTQWLDRQAPESVWTTSVTVFEIRFGLARLPAGRRRTGLERGFQTLLTDDLAGRILPLDRAAADQAARLAALRAAAGRTVELRDALLAGIVLARGCALATRNARHFSDLPERNSRVTLVDPWAED